MPDPTRQTHATEHTSDDSRGALDPTLARPDGAPDPLARAAGPQFAPPAHAGELGTFGRYRVLQKLGQGGMGAVYLAYDSTLERKVALKVMLGGSAADPEARERFLREARAVAKVKSDHVVTIFDVGEQAGTPFIAMEYLLGLPLDQYLRQKGELPLAQVLRVCEETARGLAAVHELGLIHRDIKPGNLWLEAPHGRVKLLDFGLARVETEDTHLTGTGTVMGTPAFMSPEQGRGKKLDPRSDLFTLGVLLYRLCTGKMPFVGDTTMAILTALAVDTPTAPRLLRPDLPEALEAVIVKLLQKTPADRYQSAAEVARALYAVAAGPLPVVVAVPVQAFAVAAQTQNVWESIDDDSRSAAVPLATPAATEVEEPPAPRRARREPARPVSKTPIYLAAAGLLIASAVLAVVLWPKKKPVEEAKEPDKPSAPGKKDPPKPPPGAPATGDRKIAEFVLTKGGGVFFNTANGLGRAGNVGELPAGPLEVTGIELFGKQWVSEDTERLRGLRALTRLKIHDTSVGESGLKAFEGTTQLAELHIELSPITDLSLANFAGCKNLQVLSLFATGIGNPGLLSFAACKNLTHLSVSDTTVDDTGLKALADNPNLLGLTVGSTKATGRTLERFTANPKLQLLSAFQLNLTDADLVHLKKWRELWHLTISDNPIGDAGLAHLVGLPLSYLDLRGTKVSDAGVAHLEKFSKLTDLYLSGKDVTVTEKRVKELAARLPACRIEWNGGTIEPSAAADPMAAARWLLENKKLAKIGIVVNGQYRSTSVLPNEPFTVRQLDFNPTNNGGKLLAGDVKRLAAFTALEAVYLSHTPVTDEGFAALAGLTNLKRLTLGDTSVTAASAKTVRGFPNLEYLHGPSDDAWMKALAGTPSLRSLLYYRQAVSDEGMATLASYPNLTALELYECAISDAGVRKVKELKGLRSLRLRGLKPDLLKELIAAHPNCEIHAWQDGVGGWEVVNKGPQRRFAEFVIGLGGSVQCDGYAPEKMTKVEHLPGGYADLTFVDLHGLSRDLTDADAPTFELVKGADRLRGFVCTNGGLRSAHLLPLAPAAGLKLLSLSGTGVTDDAVANFRAAKALESLTLSHAPVGDKGLGHFKGCAALVYLNLERTATSDAGLAHFRALPALTDAVVSGNRIGDAGLAHLATCPKLRQIQASDTDVTDDGLKALYGLPLVSLTVKGTKVTERGAKALAAKVPDCKIEWDGGVIVPKFAPPNVVPKVGAGTDRAAAEALLALGGQVRSAAVSAKETITDPKRLPPGPFVLGYVLLETKDQPPAQLDAALAACAACKELQTVVLNGPLVTNDMVARFKDCPKLNRLTIQRTPVTGAGLTPFKAHPALRVVSLEKADIGDEVLDALSANPELTFLDVRGTRVTAAKVAEFAKAAPKCRVSWPGGVIEPAKK